MTSRPPSSQSSSEWDEAAAAVRFIAEACETSGVRPKMAVGYRALEARIVFGEPLADGDKAAIERAKRFRREHWND